MSSSRALRPAVLAWTLILGAVSAAACGGPAPATETPTAAASLEAGPPRLADGVVAMEALCEAGADEVCDALDSDCDGRIDEGCAGAAAGALEVAVAWNGAADVDLELEAPDGAEADAPIEAGCDDPRVERRVLRTVTPGRYVVRLRHADACGAEDPITASVSVSVQGELLGTFNRALEAGAPADVLELDLAAR